MHRPSASPQSPLPNPSQVACFCHTVMATQLVASGGLPIGRTQAESERLQRQTTEALEAQLRCVWGVGGGGGEGEGICAPLHMPCC